MYSAKIIKISRFGLFYRFVRDVIYKRQILEDFIVRYQSVTADTYFPDDKTSTGVFREIGLCKFANQASIRADRLLRTEQLAIVPGYTNKTKDIQENRSMHKRITLAFGYIKISYVHS